MDFEGERERDREYENRLFYVQGLRKEKCLDVLDDQSSYNLCTSLILE